MGGEARVRETLVDMIDLKEGDRVLELCCGTGSTTSYLAAKIGKDSKIEAIDLSEGQIGIAKRKPHPPNIEFAVMDASRTSSPGSARPLGSDHVPS